VLISTHEVCLPNRDILYINPTCAEHHRTSFSTAGSCPAEWRLGAYSTYKDPANHDLVDCPVLQCLLSRSSLVVTNSQHKVNTRSLVNMQWATLVAAALFTQNVAAQGSMLRFACSQLVVERTDPLVNPGMKYTPHLHQIVGGMFKFGSS
jgi:hypothetical protein